MKMTYAVYPGERCRIYILYRLLHPFVRVQYFFERLCKDMETRIAVMGIIVENTESVERLNTLLHDFGEFIIGRMGLPYKEKNINIVSIAIDAPQDVISELSGKIGKIPGISVKTAYSKVITHE